MPRLDLLRQCPLLVLLVAAPGCGTDTVGNPDRCNVKIVTVTPALASLLVGDTLTMRAAYTPGISADCIPAVPATSLRWSSGDSLTVSIDSVTGALSARRAGSTQVSVHVPSGSANIGGAQITVTAP